MSLLCRIICHCSFVVVMCQFLLLVLIVLLYVSCLSSIFVDYVFILFVLVIVDYYCCMSISLLSILVLLILVLLFYRLYLCQYVLLCCLLLSLCYMIIVRDDCWIASQQPLDCSEILVVLYVPLSPSCRTLAIGLPLSVLVVEINDLVWDCILLLDPACD